MGDKGTGGDMASEFEGLGDKILARTLELGEGLIDLTEGQLKDLGAITDTAGKAIAGDERLQKHLIAQLSLRKFSSEARAYLEIVAFREAVAQAILDVVGALVSQGAKLAGEALAGALTGALG